MAVSHIKTVTVADGASTQVVRPSDWNSAHMQYMTLGGNTAGASTLSGVNIVLAGGDNVTLSGNGSTVSFVGPPTSQFLTTAAPPGAYLTTAAQSDHSHGGLSLFNLTGTSASNGLTLSAALGGGAGDGGNVIAAGGSTNGSTGTVVFGDSNGVSFGLNAGTVTASHNAYTGATTQFLTTAALSNHVHSLNEIANASGDVLFTFGSGRQIQFQFSNTGTFTTNANKQGLFEIDVQGNLVDGADAFHVHQSDNDPTIDLVHLEAWGTNVTALRLSASASVAMELNKPMKFVGAGGQTASVPLILQSGMTNSVQYLNANFLQGSQASQFQPAGAYLTTAALSQDSSKYAGTTTAVTGSISVTLNTAGINLSIPAFLTTAQAPGAYLTTARASNDAVGLNTALTGNGVAWTVNSSGLSLNVPAFLTTAANSTHTHAQYLTTARASNDGVGLNTALTANGVAWTVNSSGLSLNVPAFLTTAANSTHSHGNPTLALTNLTGTTASASNGFTLSLSAAAAGGGGAAISAAGGSQSTGTVIFSNSNGVSFGYNAGTITATVVPGAAAGIAAFGGSNTTYTSGTVALTGAGAITIGSDTGQKIVVSGPATSQLTVAGWLSLSSNGSTITISGPNVANAHSAFFAFVGEDYPEARALITNITAINTRPVFFPFDVGGNLSAGEIHWTMSRSTSNSNAFTVQAGIYSYSNSTRIDLISSTQVGFSNTATASISGIRAFEVPMPVTSLTPGQYVLAMNFSANGGNTASMNYSLMGGTTANIPNINVIVSGTDNYHTYTSHPTIPFWGRYTANSGGLPASVAFVDVIHGFSGASAPLPVHFHLVNHY